MELLKVRTDQPAESQKRMECPVCGDWFSDMVIQHHAWNCDGSKVFEEGLMTQREAAAITGEEHPSATCMSYFHQHVNDVGSVVSSDTSSVSHSGTENSQETATLETQECPLCCQCFPADHIVEHAAFCNGPSYYKTQNREIPSCSRIQDQEIPSCSRTQDREIPSCSRIQDHEIPSCSRTQDREIPSEDASSTMELFWSYMNTKEHVAPGAAAGTEGPSRALSSRGTEGSIDLEKALQYLVKIEHGITQDPEFKQVFGPILKNPNPLQVLQSLSKAIFSRSVSTGAGKAAPVFVFFHLAKLFLPTILESETFAIFKKWVEVFILEMVLPRISQMGGWGSVLCAVGALIASGLAVGLMMLLMTPNSNK
ncbi:uncharacterized protein LOC121271642 isoform X2 [Carcharodon carcharias]|uniref:uncharacterized protein LOC121271642 isoform X2 n=1 Tax=Carcharodon carcharias TaxID=13397 RepID=UPI001B7EC412|nr:uncharacterized protein LOC121271642 isoform X2 [Carcharodon carcharias]